MPFRVASLLLEGVKLRVKCLEGLSGFDFVPKINISCNSMNQDINPELLTICMYKCNEMK